ncbi:MAG: PAS domain S-box protein [Methanobacterium sp.]
MAQFKKPNNNGEMLEYQAELLSKVSDAVISTDINFNIKTWNKAAEKLYGWSEQEAKGKSIIELLKTDYLGQDEGQIIRDFTKEGLWEGEVIQYNKNGKKLYIDSSVTLLEDSSGDAVGAVAINRDITDCRKSEEAFRHEISGAPKSEILSALKESEEKFSKAFHSNSAGMLITTDSKIVEVNEAYAKLTGYKREELIGNSVTDLNLFSVEEREGLVKRLIKEGSVHNEEIKLNTRTGEKRPVLFTSEFIELNGKQSIFTIAYDIKERKKLEKSLQESESILKSFFNSNIIFMSVIELLDDDFIYKLPNKYMAEYIGLTIDEFEGKSAKELKISDFEREKWLNIFYQCLKSHEPISLEYQVPGRKSWFYGMVNLIDYPTLPRPHFSFVAFEITKRKNAEAKLEIEKRQLQAVIENIPVGIIIAEAPSGKLLLGNKQIDLIWGHPFLKAAEIGEYEQYKGFYKNGTPYKAEEWPLARSITTGEIVIDEEITILRGDGTKGFLSVSSAPIRDNENNIIMGVVIDVDITERKHIEDELKHARTHLEEQVEERTVELEDAYNELKESEEKYRTLFETAPVGIFHSTAEGKLIDANPELARIFGYDSPENLISIVNKSSFAEVLYLNPDSRSDYVKSAIKTGDWVKNENLYRRKDGEIMIGDLNFRSIGIGSKNNYLLEGFITDITERKKAEEGLKVAYSALRESEIKYSSIVENSDDAILLTSPDGRILTANSAAEKMFGYIEEEICKLGRSGILDTGDPNLPRMLEERARTGSTKGELTFIRSDGSKFPGEISTTLFKDRNGNDRTSMIIRDITKRKKIESEKEELIGELRRSNDELQQFAYITSHDLQEPLRTMGSYAGLLKHRYEGQLDEDADVFINYRVSGSIRMQDMIKGLLEYSRVGSRGEEFKEFNAEDALKTSLISLESSIKDNNVEITYDSLPVIFADEDQIVRVFLNLISNAIKFRKPDESPIINISAKKEKNEYIFSVSDNSIGMEQEYTDKIFEIFKRLHAIGEYEGAGIGLAIVKRIINRHGGRVWVESKYGVGSTFYFTIPLRSE